MSFALYKASDAWLPLGWRFFPSVQAMLALFRILSKFRRCLCHKRSVIFPSKFLAYVNKALAYAIIALDNLFAAWGVLFFLLQLTLGLLHNKGGVDEGRLRKRVGVFKRCIRR